MSLPRWATLTTVAGGLGLGIGIMSILLNKEKDKFAQNASFILKAIETMQTRPECKKLLGEKIDVGKASFSDGFGKLERKHVQLRVPLKGENDNAYLYAYARKKEEKDKFRLYKLEATFSKIQGKKLILLDRTSEQDEVDEQETKEQSNEEKEKTKKLNAAEGKKELSPEERRKLAKETMKTWQ